MIWYLIWFEFTKGDVSPKSIFFDLVQFSISSYKIKDSKCFDMAGIYQLWAARTLESSERLQYPVTPSQEPSGQQEAASGGGQGGGGLGRRVSRVESLRRLLLGASSMDSRRLFDRKKQRYTVDKSIGKEYNFYVYRFVIYNLQVQILVTMERRTCLTGKVERCRLKNHIFCCLSCLQIHFLSFRTSSQFNISCDSFDLDSISQVRLGNITFWSLLLSLFFIIVHTLIIRTITFCLLGEPGG